ncbi:hypothetical protein F442_01508 [Phytophthora nicotianae P10297]|uniref:Uncharacterized protein n=1 Tax=Phytophthora nicotianae P10297 TaxID=1317064 RepID=W3A339_PHYNI|nr:hypothetical protein F442_01508 [Phytophthora nicotianae P10297]
MWVRGMLLHLRSARNNTPFCEVQQSTARKKLPSPASWIKSGGHFCRWLASPLTSICSFSLWNFLRPAHKPHHGRLQPTSHHPHRQVCALRPEDNHLQREKHECQAPPESARRDAPFQPRERRINDREKGSVGEAVHFVASYDRHGPATSLRSDCWKFGMEAKREPAPVHFF